MTGQASGTAAAPEAFREIAFRRLPLCVMSTAAIVAVVGGTEWSERLGPLPWLLSLVAVGLPHGAADLAVSRRSCQGQGGALAAVWSIYVAGMMVVAAGFAIAPLASMVIFLAISCWHFGAAHLDTDAAAGRPSSRTVAVLARGCAVLAAPLVVWPAATAAAAGDMAEVAALVAGSEGMPTLVAPEAVMAVGGVLAVIAVTAVGVEGVLALRRDGGMKDWCRMLVEVAVIAGLGVCTAPLFAVGTYFLVWHGWRQMAGLDETLSASPARSGSELVRHILHIHMAALPLLLPTWIMLGGIWWLWLPEPPLRGLAIVSIAGYLVVTPAHELLGDFVRTNVGMPAILRRGMWPRGCPPVRPEPRGRLPSGGTSRSGLRRARPAVWG